MNFHAPIIEQARTFAASSPAGSKPPHSHGTARRGPDERGRSAAAFELMNAPQMRRDSYLARNAMRWICLALAWIFAGLFLAFIGGGGAAKVIGNVSHAFEAERLNH